MWGWETGWLPPSDCTQPINKAHPHHKQSANEQIDLSGNQAVCGSHVYVGMTRKQRMKGVGFLLQHNGSVINAQQGVNEDGRKESLTPPHTATERSTDWCCDSKEIIARYNNCHCWCLTPSWSKPMIPLRLTQSIGGSWWCLSAGTPGMDANHWHQMPLIHKSRVQTICLVHIFKQNTLTIFLSFERDIGWTTCQRHMKEQRGRKEAVHLHGLMHVLISPFTAH